MSSSKTSSRFRLFTLLLGVIVLSLFGSLIAADRALRAADHEAAVLDAHGAALATERELRLNAEKLTHLSARATRGGRSIPIDTTATLGTFDGVWVLDTSGVVVWRWEARGSRGADSTILATLTHEVTPGAWPRVRAIPAAPGRPEAALLVGVPLIQRGERVGTAIGRLPATQLLAAVQTSALTRAWTQLRIARRPIAETGSQDRTGARYSATAVVGLPGDAIEIEAAHEQSDRALRTALWMLGVVAVVALLAVLARERKQTMQVAVRTTELERLYEEVARSNRMKSEFLANVSHELRTPLNAIVGFVEMLREGVYGELSPRQALPVDRIAASATHLRHLVDRLLDIAKIAAGRLEIHSEPLVLRPFVLNVASEMESLVSERGLALSIGVGPSLPRIRTDQTHLRQILINLIGNAVKYTPSGVIQVRAKLMGNDVTPAAIDEQSPKVGSPPDPQRLWVALQVSDTGVGIAEADLERIFDEFEQVNAGARTDSARRGTGLGLAISRRLARLLGGDLTVVSEVGKGSVFTVWLPLDQPERAMVS